MKRNQVTTENTQIEDPVLTETTDQCASEVNEASRLHFVVSLL